MINDQQLAQKLAQSPSVDRITPQHIDAVVADAHFIRASDTLTLCVIKSVNGFEVVGKSACADPANYDQAIGERVAFDDAKRQLWPLEGYLLRERLHQKALAVASGRWPAPPADDTCCTNPEAEPPADASGAPETTTGETTPDNTGTAEQAAA